MTGTAAHRAETRPKSRPSTPLRRALLLEWRSHRELLLIYAALTAGIVLIAVVADLRFGVVGIVLAARLPADLADRVPEDGRQLRSALGISRADAVRARTLVVCGGQLMLALGAVGEILLTDWLPSERHMISFDIRRGEEGPHPMAWPDHLVDIGAWTGAILWTHALSGGRAFRLGARPSPLGTMAQYVGICLLAGFLFVSTVQLIQMALTGVDTGAVAALESMPQFVIAARSAQLLTLLPVLGGGLLALLLAHRRWVRRA